MGSSRKYLGAAKWCKPQGFTVQNACLGGFCWWAVYTCLCGGIVTDACLSGTTQRVVCGRKWKGEGQGCGGHYLGSCAQTTRGFERLTFRPCIYLQASTAATTPRYSPPGSSRLSSGCGLHLDVLHLDLLSVLN